MSNTELNTIPITDAHTHMWDPSVITCDWLPSVPDLNRAFLLEDYNEATKGINIQRMVFVEPNSIPSHNLKEVEWVEEIAGRDPRMQGIVAYAELTDTEGIDANLEKLASHSLVKGIRHNIQFNPEGFATQSIFVEGIKKAFNLDLLFDLCLTYGQLPEVVDLLKQLPEHTMILDHCAKPGIKDGEMEEWKKGIKQISEFQHLSCKISGLLTEADCENWTPEQIIPYMDHVRECFGSDRILFGGDWPVSNLAGGYSAWHGLVTNWTKNWSEDEQIKFYHNNAGSLYKLL